MSKFKIGQSIILNEKISHISWYVPDILHVKKIYEPGTIVASKIGITGDINDMNFYEIIECINSITGKSSLYHESKLLPFPLQRLRDERIDELLDNLLE